MIKYCIFDFDGTLADTFEGIVRTVRATLEKMGLPDQPDDKIRCAIGLPLAESLKMAGDIPDERIQEAVSTYRSTFDIIAPKYVLPFPGVIETLHSLNDSGVRLAIATSRGTNSLTLFLKEFGVFDLFSEMVTASDGIIAKPKPDMVLHLLEVSGCDKDETLVIGDTTFDLMMGAGAGCRTCGVTWGNHTREMLATAAPDYVIDNIIDLIDIVNS